MNTERSSEKSRSQCTNKVDEEFNWNELDKNSVMKTDHKKEEFHQGATTRKWKVKISEIFTPRKIECILPSSLRHAEYKKDISKQTVQALIESGDHDHISETVAFFVQPRPFLHHICARQKKDSSTQIC